MRVRVAVWFVLSPAQAWTVTLSSRTLLRESSRTAILVDLGKCKNNTCYQATSYTHTQLAGLLADRIRATPVRRHEVRSNIAVVHGYRLLGTWSGLASLPMPWGNFGDFDRGSAVAFLSQEQKEREQKIFRPESVAPRAAQNVQEAAADMVGFARLSGDTSQMDNLNGCA